jgi:hypothetical protein
MSMGLRTLMLRVLYSLSQPNEVHLKKLKPLGIKDYMYLTRLGKAIYAMYIVLQLIHQKTVYIRTHILGVKAAWGYQ